MIPSPSTLPLGARAVAGAFLVSGPIHLVRPQVFEPLIPAALRSRDRELVYASGVAELVCAAGLVVPAVRRPAGIASAVLLAAVLPGNVQMALDAHRRVQRKGSTPIREVMRVGTIARVPLQLPMIRAVLRAGRP
ncbi:DoxX family protein [Luteipulveratus halotolerans]|uniref:DoxX family protein n=1 Tax=Luteipulveratus halotolerans TaxID=1631356 RepID=UPI001E34AC20|nr:DoxX family protein [Luteipulveratus halotolerans]